MASVVAKVARDKLMVALDSEYPEYGFAKHKGYGTKAHMDAIRAHGLSVEHRRSFCRNIF
jgi:ribonuclease HII